MMYDKGYTTGVFDLFHVGHLHVLQRAKQQCRHLIVGVTTDDLVIQLKGRAPVIPFDERIEIVANIACVDQAVAESSADKLAAWKALRFDVTFKGDDWKGTPKWNALEKSFAEVGVSVVYFPYTQHTSSTQLRKVLDRLYDEPGGGR